MEKFLSTLITILIILFALKWLAKLLLPWLLKTFAKRMMRQAGFNTDPFTSTADSPNAPPRSSPRPSHSDEFLRPKRHLGQSISDTLGGEYIDYQEIN